MVRIAVVVTLVALTGTAAVAGKPAGKPTAPDTIVCRTVDSTGSRLSRNKVCHTVAEWASLKQTDRLDIERIQNNRYKSE